MKKTFLIGWLLGGILIASFAQQPELQSMLSELENAVGEVETAKTVFLQRFALDPEKPWRATLSVEMVNTRNDKRETQEYDLNLGDLDRNLIRWQDKSREQYVSAKTERTQKTIRFRENGELGNYVSELIIYTSEIDQARNIEDLLRKIAPLARQAWEESIRIGTTFEALSDWLTWNVQSVNRDNELVGQTWKSNEQSPDYIQFTSRETNGATAIYDLSLADVNPASLDLEIKGKDVIVVLETKRRQDFIAVTKDGELAEYAHKMEILCPGVDEGRMLFRVLQMTIPLAETILEARLPDFPALDEKLNGFSELLVEIRTDEEVILPGITKKPVANLQLETTDLSKGKSTLDNYYFHFGDLSPDKVDIDIKGTSILVKAEGKGRKRFVQQYVDGDPEGYQDEVNFPAASIEKARLMVHLLPKIISEAAQLPQPTGDLAWLQQALQKNELGDGRQFLEPTDPGESCKLRYTYTDTGGKREEEQIYEFNMYDLDAKKIELDISGKNLELKLVTPHREKIINYYKNGEPAFVNEVIWEFSNLEIAKKAKATMMDLIEKCDR